MPMSVNSLKDKLKTNIQGYLTVTDATQLENICLAIAQAVYDEITSNAVVTVTGVTSGPSAASGTVS